MIKILENVNLKFLANIYMLCGKWHNRNPNSISKQKCAILFSRAIPTKINEDGYQNLWVNEARLQEKVKM